MRQDKSCDGLITNAVTALQRAHDLSVYTRPRILRKGTDRKEIRAQPFECLERWVEQAASMPFQ